MTECTPAPARIDCVVAPVLHKYVNAPEPPVTVAVSKTGGLPAQIVVIGGVTITTCSGTNVTRMVSQIGSTLHPPTSSPHTR